MSRSDQTRSRRRSGQRQLVAGLVLLLAGCAPDYSPNTYSGAAAQQAAKVEQGLIVGVRQVEVISQGAAGALTGGAAGGIVGSQTSGGVGSAIGALGGSLIGGLVGSTVERNVTDTKAFEYIVRKGNNDLLSVTQKDEKPLVLGQRVLVIAGSQARIVPDYTVQLDPRGARGVEAQAAKDAQAGTPTKPPDPPPGQPMNLQPAPTSAGPPDIPVPPQPGSSAAPNETPSTPPTNPVVAPPLAVQAEPLAPAGGAPPDPAIARP